MLAIAILARYSFHMAGSWRWIYVVTAVMALYLNVFVLVVQSFEKVPALHAMAPTQTEGPFKIAQLVVLVLFIVLTMRGEEVPPPDAIVHSLVFVETPAALFPQPACVHHLDQ